MENSSAVFATLYREGVRYFENGDFRTAAAMLEKAFSHHSDEPDLCFFLAVVYKTLRHYDRSDSFFRKALALRPDAVAFLYQYALLHNERHHIDEAIACLQRCAELAPDNAQVQNDLGVLYHQKKLDDKAAAFFQKAASLNPDYLVPRVNLGYVYLARQNTDELGRLLDSLTEKERGDPDAAELRRKYGELGNAGLLHPDAPKTELLFSEHSFRISPLKMIRDFGRQEGHGPVGLSLVIPVFNERDNLEELYSELTLVVKNLRERCEIIFVDDGSTDGSREKLERIAHADSRVKVIEFRRNYGQTAALGAGFKYARGEVVVTLDADLQNDPADIPRLLEKMAEGYDLVNGWRQKRRDKLLSRRFPSMIANRIINKLIEGTNVQLKDFGCTLKAYKKGIVKNINLYGEMHRFIPVFAAWLGVSVTEIPVNHRPRKSGVAKYNLSRVSRVIFDLIVVRFFSDYMTRPIQFFGKIARKMVFWGVPVFVLLWALRFVTPVIISVNTLLVCSALLLFSVFQILGMGLLGELMIRFYFEVQRKDYFVVESIMNDEESR